MEVSLLLHIYYPNGIVFSLYFIVDMCICVYVYVWQDDMTDRHDKLTYVECVR